MELTGKITGINRDWLSNTLNIMFNVCEEPVEEINDLMQCDKLSICVKKFRKKRSLDANAYLWIILTKIANHPQIKSSKDEVYEDMLQKYGHIYQDDEGYITVTVKADVDMSKIEGHWKFYKSNGKFSSYLMIKGTSEYDTAEMAHFIDCVVQEAKELGIETMPPDELERMVSAWKA